MKYYLLENSKWTRAHQYTLSGMRQIKLYDDNLQFIGIGLYKQLTNDSASGKVAQTK